MRASVRPRDGFRSLAHRAGAPAALVGAALAIASGVLIALNPLYALVVAGGIALLVVGAFTSTFERIFLGLAAVALMGYAFAGRGFAYLGPGTLLTGQRYAPPYVGELVLLAALAILVFRFDRLRSGIREYAIFAFMLWGALRTVPYLDQYGLDSLRDATVWGYAAIALAITALTTVPRLEAAQRIYASLAPVFLIWFLAVTVVSLVSTIPEYGFGVPLVSIKGGDAGVQLAGIAAIFVAQRRTSQSSQLGLWTLWLVGAGVVAATTRGGFLAIMAGLGVVAALRPTTRLAQLGALALPLLLAAALLVPALPTAGGRSISVDQIGANITSLFTTGTGQGLEGTKQFRLAWWSEIVGYTVGGPYFWNGKGFGVNLADDDGFQSELDGTLRAPHNTHLTILARMGVPGLLLWLTVLFALLGSLALRAIRARRAGDEAWAARLAWLAAFLTASLVNTTFDPALEGPQGGMWFWALAGLALGACRVYDQTGPQRDVAGGAMGRSSIAAARR